MLQILNMITVLGRAVILLYLKFQLYDLKCFRIIKFYHRTRQEREMYRKRRKQRKTHPQVISSPTKRKEMMEI